MEVPLSAKVMISRALMGFFSSSCAGNDSVRQPSLHGVEDSLFLSLVFTAEHSKALLGYLGRAVGLVGYIETRSTAGLFDL